MPRPPSKKTICERFKLRFKGLTRIYLLIVLGKNQAVRNLTSSFDINGPDINAQLDVIPAKKLKTMEGKHKFLQFLEQMKSKK